MNLVEITLLINSPTIPDDMKEYYIQKRQDLVNEINYAIEGQELTLKQMLQISPRPELADTL